jgi:hypothetical protein
MGSTSHPFKVIEEYECVLKLPYLFGPDVDILELSLSDSTTGKRINIPGRGSQCDHIDVVDVCSSTHAESEGELDWMCPVCGLEYIHTADIEVDGLLLSILKELDAVDTDGNVRAINLNVNGEWTHVSDDPAERVPMMRKKRARLTLAQASAVAGISSTGEIVLSESEDDPAPRQQSKGKVDPVVVDLDSD